MAGGGEKRREEERIGGKRAEGNGTCSRAGKERNLGRSLAGWKDQSGRSRQDAAPAVRGKRVDLSKCLVWGEEGAAHLPR